MPNQVGYVFHKGSSWFVTYYDTFFVDGVSKRKQKCKKLPIPYGGAYRSEASVRPFVDEILAPINSGTVHASSNTLLTDFVENVYLPYIATQVRPYTLKCYRQFWQRHLVGRVGKITLREFRTVDAVRIISAIAAPQTVGKSTLKYLKHFLSGIFTTAKNLGYLDAANPITGLKIPRQVKETEPTHAYSLTEIDNMLLALTGQTRIIVLTAALTGLRASELRGLRWSDFNGTELFVNRSIVESNVSETKNATSHAPVPVIKQLSTALADHRANLGVRAAADLPIFQSGHAKPVNLKNLAKRVIKDAVEKCVKCKKSESKHEAETHPYELDKATEWHGYHAFRRGLATNLHALGISDKNIQAILRHSNVAITQATYIKTTNEGQIDAMETLSLELQRRESSNECRTNQTELVQ